jgi:hypothetical protein
MSERNLKKAGAGQDSYKFLGIKTGGLVGMIAGPIGSLIGSGGNPAEPTPAANSEDDFADEIRGRYPVTAKSNCYDLAAIEKSVKQEIDSLYQKNTLAKSQATISGNTTIINGYQKYHDQVVAYYNKMQCDNVIAAAEQQESVDANLSLLDRAQALTKNVDKTATYIIIGMIILVVGVAGVVVYKKLKH